MTEAPFEYINRAPAEPLTRFVESVWYARGTVPYKREKIAPTGSSVAVIVLGSPLLVTPDDGDGATLRADRGFLLGPHDRPVINEPTSETFAVGVVATPVGCRSAFGIDPETVRGRALGLDRGWLGGVTLRTELLHASGPLQMLDLVEESLAVSLDPDVSGLERCERAVTMLEEAPTRPIASLAQELGVSHGHLDREFTRVVGLSPRVLARLLRLRRLLAGLDVHGEVAWARLSTEFGWYDQAHLIRDFKRHTGVTPTRYIEAQRSALPVGEPGDEAGFVPEL